MKGTIYVYREGKVVPKQEKKLITLEPFEPLSDLYGDYVTLMNRLLLETYFVPRKILEGG